MENEFNEKPISKRFVNKFIYIDDKWINYDRLKQKDFYIFLILSYSLHV